MDNKGQSALEYLMTYGWALIVIAIVIGVLIIVTEEHIPTSSTSGGVICQSGSPQMVLKETSFNPGTDGVGFTLQNATGGSVVLVADCVGAAAVDGTYITDSSGVAECTAGTITNGGTFIVTTLDAAASGTGSFTGGTATVGYTTAGGLSASVTVNCSGTI
ncbi:MAG: hypothetical protein QGI60_00730 [archaeon]|jgi:hypothetical protein|nr:hypothetical protein [archaeon]